jgi:protein-disulfide isomerase
VRPRDALPRAIQELQTPGVLTVVEFADFECPHCRRLHPILNAELAALEQPVRVVRFQVPLSFHIHAAEAARAAVCAEQFERGEAMANLLFAGSLESSALFTHAAKLGIPEAAFRTCLDAESTRATLAQHYATFKSLGKSIVPLTFIGSEKLEGYAGPEAVALLFRRATRTRFAGLSAYSFGAALLVAVVALFAIGRRRAETGSPE